MRVVLDTDVIVAALRSPEGASAALVLCAERGEVTVVLSVPLALEYEATCLLPEHRLASGLSAAAVQAFVTALIGLVEPVVIHFRWRPQLRDPGDEMVLETAINGRTEALVTFNRRAYMDAPRKFGIEVLLPSEALAKLREGR